MRPKPSFSKYIVQSFHDCTQFDTLEYAKRHASLNAPARIWDSKDVTEIQGRDILSIHAGRLPIFTVWSKSDV